MVSVPLKYREEAYAELAKLHGMPVKGFLAYAEKRVAALEDEMRVRAQQESDSEVNQDLQEETKRSIK
jgi:hypothetical protein